MSLLGDLTQFVPTSYAPPPMPTKYHATGNPMDLTTDPTVPKAIALVELAGGRDLTLHDRRLFDTLLANAYQRIEADEEHSVRLADLRRLAMRKTAESPHQTNERINTSITRLMRLILDYENLDSEGEHWRCKAPLIAFAKYSERKDILYYEFPKQLRPLLVDPALHARIRLSVIYQFESKYSLILYEILQRHADRRRPCWVLTIDVDKLRRLLGVEDKFANFKDLRKRVLDPAKTEIDAHAEFTINFKEIREGGPTATRGRGSKVLKVEFTVTRKETAQAKKTAHLNDRTKGEKRAAKTGGMAQQIDIDHVSRALRFLEMADFPTRQRWAEFAEKTAKVNMPPAPTAHENLRKWVPLVAEKIVETERLVR